MSSVRIYELAKELGISNRELIAALADLGIEVKSHSSTIDEQSADLVTERIKKEQKAQKTQEKTAAKEHIETRKTEDIKKTEPATKKHEEKKPVPPKGKVELPQQATVRQLAELLKVQTADIQKALVKQGALVAVNQVVPPELAKKVVENLGFEVVLPPPPPPKQEVPSPSKPSEAKPVTAPPKLVTPPTKTEPEKPSKPLNLVPRPPIVTILGHVDHGKTTLLDAIRQTNVTDQEFGGITQHIGAYQVEVDGKKITFLDTPGHEAFTAMRARGAQVTDLAVLVVAADDGVMPQTIEAIDHARAAGVPILVAINKIDKPEANIDRTRQQLAEHGLVVEEWGGDTVAVQISAKEKQGLDELLEMIILVSELQELKADPNGPLDATVIEAKLDRGRGPVATVLVKSGTLKVGDSIVVGESYGKIKLMLDDRGHRISKAGPSTPVEIAGLSSVPEAGDKVEVVKDEKEARQIAESRIEEQREAKLAATQRVTLADLYRQLREGVVKELNVILKGDVQGSVEAISQSLNKLSTEDVRLNIIHTGVGNVTESDVLLASASNAVIIGFNVKIDPQAKRMAESEGIDVRLYRVIYELLDDVKSAMQGLLEPIKKEIIIGHAEVRATFKLPRGVVAGCYVTDGKMERGAEARILRNGKTLHTGRIASLRHLKEDVREMAAGFECGIIVDGFSEYEIGDVVEAYTIQEVTPG
ncbi:MAG: translation initiation factor IF-2 [Armatimonadota bacterium]|nr:translation initiation factor IF-2 [Armatimonadota bacterium]